MEDNKANEAGILDFLACMDEYKIQTPLHSGDVILQEDHDEELSKTPLRVIDEYYSNDRKGRGIWNSCFRHSHALACGMSATASASTLPTREYPCTHPHARHHTNEEKLILETVKKELEHWRRVPPSSYPTIAYRAGDLRDIYDDHEVQKSKEERQAATERLEIIKNAKGTMLRSKLVAEVCEALLASGSLERYVFSSPADAPSSSNVPFSSSDPKRKPEPLQGTSVKHRSQGNLFARARTLSHWERPRKHSTPQCFHHLIDWDATCAEHKHDPTCGNLFLHFVSIISAYILITQEASTIRQLEREVMEQHGLMTATGPDKTLLCGI